MNNTKLKNNTINIIYKLYKTQGIKRALNAANNLLTEIENTDNSVSEKNIIKGELAEITLYIILKEFSKYLKFKTYLCKGLFVKNEDTGQVTEIDIVFATPYRIYLIECKSYSGKKKVIKKECSLYRNGRLIIDVYEQNKLHTLIFNKCYGGLTKNKSKPYKMILYDYEFRDLRSKDNINKMPVVNQDTILNFLINDINTYNEKCVNIEALSKRLSIDIKYKSKDLHLLHREQLKY